jgi:hypothetical protein
VSASTNFMRLLRVLPFIRIYMQPSYSLVQLQAFHPSTTPIFRRTYIHAETTPSRSPAEHFFAPPAKKDGLVALSFGYAYFCVLHRVCGSQQSPASASVLALEPPGMLSPFHKCTLRQGPNAVSGCSRTPCAYRCPGNRPGRFVNAL